MNAVGIDVSKSKSVVAIMRPFGEIVSTPFEIKHTASDIHSLIELINSVEGESRIVMEHTGRYYEVLAHQLSEADLFVSAVNPKLIKDFDNDSLRKIKSDKADAVKMVQSLCILFFIYFLLMLQCNLALRCCSGYFYQAARFLFLIYSIFI